MERKIWQRATPDSPVSPTEDPPLTARMDMAKGLKLHIAHFQGMEEWVADGREADENFALVCKNADLGLCFNRIDRRLLFFN